VGTAVGKGIPQKHYSTRRNFFSFSTFFIIKKIFGDLLRDMRVYPVDDGID
jgi:hypothetical protein